MSDSVLRHIPSVGQLLEHPALAPLLTGPARAWTTRLVQRVVGEERDRLRREKPADLSRDDVVDRVVAAVLARRDALMGPSLRRVVNATGILVHTNLGRSLQPPRAVEWMTLAARHNVDLEMDLATNRRGHRGRKVEEKLALLTGAEDALVVNNNAAALWLAVRSLSMGSRVLLSKGEVVAIGGSFRMDDILAETGCELVEVGTTNRTRLDDYREALAPGAVVLKVHRSNFALSGFTEEVSVRDLAELCRETGHALVYDAGSGLLEDLGAEGLEDHQTVDRDLADGPALVTCSGDKLFGGGQAGLILGRADLVAAARKHPMRRAFRVDKTTLASLDGVLTHYLAGDAPEAVPTLMQVKRTTAELETLAARLRDLLTPDAPAGWTPEIVDGRAQVGGGCSAEAELPTRLLLWHGPHEELERRHATLRGGDPAVLCRISAEGLAFDPRSLREEDLEVITDAWRRAAGEERA